MTTRCLAAVTCSYALACAAPRPLSVEAAPEHTAPVTSAPRTHASEPARQTTRGPTDGWFEVWQGNGNGHALATVHVENVAIHVSSDVAKAFYCEGPFATAESVPAVAFGVTEVLLLGEQRRLYYQIDHDPLDQQPRGAWRYSIATDDGETIAGSPLCAACHERGSSDPFFRPFVTTGCK